MQCCHSKIPYLPVLLPPTSSHHCAFYGYFTVYLVESNMELCEYCVCHVYTAFIIILLITSQCNMLSIVTVSNLFHSSHFHISSLPSSLTIFFSLREIETFRCELHSSLLFAVELCIFPSSLLLSVKENTLFCPSSVWWFLFHQLSFVSLASDFVFLVILLSFPDMLMSSLN